MKTVYRVTWMGGDYDQQTRDFDALGICGLFQQIAHLGDNYPAAVVGCLSNGQHLGKNDFFIHYQVPESIC